MAAIIRTAFNYSDDIFRFIKMSNKMNGTKCTSILQIKPPAKADIFKPSIQGVKSDVFIAQCHNFAPRIKSLSTPGYESKTLQRLYSPEFKPLRQIDENGYFVSTVIDRRTQKPVEIFIKELGPGKYELFEKSAKGSYETIARRSFNINQKLRQIEPGYMTSGSSNEIYSGIGIRCHQLAVEDAMKHNCDRILLNSIDKALPFHLKSLYKPGKIKMEESSFKELVKSCSECLPINETETLKLFSYTSKNNVYTIDWNKSLAAMNDYARKRSLPALENTTMLSLEGDTLALWKDLAKSQPITL